MNFTKPLLPLFMFAASFAHGQNFKPTPRFENLTTLDGSKVDQARLLARHKISLVYAFFVECAGACRRDMKRADDTIAEVERLTGEDVGIIALNTNIKTAMGKISGCISPGLTIDFNQMRGCAAVLPNGTTVLVSTTRAFAENELQTPAAKTAIKTMQAAAASVGLAYTVWDDGTPAHPEDFIALDSSGNYLGFLPNTMKPREMSERLRGFLSAKPPNSGARPGGMD